MLELKWFGDSIEQMQNLSDTWKMILKNMVDVPDEKTQQDWFYKIIKESTVLKPGVEHYSREKTKGKNTHFPEDISMNYLLGLIDLYITEKTLDRNLKDQEAAFRALAAGGKTGKKHADQSALAVEKADQKKAALAKKKAEWKEKQKTLAEAKKSAGNGTRPPKGTDTPKKGPASRPGATFDPKDDPGRRCFFYNLGSCNQNPCTFNHEKVPPNEFKTWMWPGAGRNSGKATGNGTPKTGLSTRSTTPNGTKKPKGGGKGKTPSIQYCGEYMKSGTCQFQTDNGYCGRLHLNAAGLEALKKKKADHQAGKGKGKGKKGKKD